MCQGLQPYACHNRTGRPRLTTYYWRLTTYRSRWPRREKQAHKSEERRASPLPTHRALSPGLTRQPTPAGAARRQRAGRRRGSHWWRCAARTRCPLASRCTSRGATRGGAIRRAACGRCCGRRGSEAASQRARSSPPRTASGSAARRGHASPSARWRSAAIDREMWREIAKETQA